MVCMQMSRSAVHQINILVHKSWEGVQMLNMKSCILLSARVIAEVLKSLADNQNGEMGVALSQLSRRN